MNVIEKIFRELPKDWDIVRLSSNLKNEKNSIKAGPFGSHLTNVDMQGHDIKVYNQRTVLDKDFQNGEYYISVEKFDELKGFIVESKDILVTTRGTIGKCVIVPNDIEVGILHPCLIKMKIDESKINTNYLEYIFNGTNIIKDQVQFLSNSTTIDVIYTQTLKDLKIAIPKDIRIQNRIVSYLNIKVAEVDLLISQKEIKLNLLEQQRQSIITEAVTKGLNPNVKMKDSGVEWIGEIPEHWETKALKYCFKVANGKEIDIELDKEDDTGINVYGSGGVFKKTDKALFDGESVLFGRKGTIGKPLYVNDAFWTVDTMYYTEFYKDSNPKWFYYLLLVYPWDMIVTQTALPSVVGSDVANTICAIPSFKEQVEVAKYLALKDEKYFKLIDNINNQIEKLKEYRQSLIYEAVTGKIDVRDMELD